MSWIGKSEGYVVAALTLSGTATALLVFKFIDQIVWSSFVQWVWSALVLGGVGKVGADAWKSSKNGSGVSGQASSPSSASPLASAGLATGLVGLLK